MRCGESVCNSLQLKESASSGNDCKNPDSGADASENVECVDSEDSVDTGNSQAEEASENVEPNQRFVDSC